MDRQVLIKEIIYRAQHRGLRELDLTCSALEPAGLAALTDDDLLGLRDLLLRASEQDLLAWLTNQEPVHPEFDHGGFDHLLAVHKARLNG